jgi:hypothetical protein
MAEHWFWWLVTAACVVWYSTIAVYVAVRGVFDIRSMLKRLSDGARPEEGKGAAPGRNDGPKSP